MLIEFDILLDRSIRSRHEMLSDILRAISSGGVTFSEIQIKIHISYRHLKIYLTYLVQNEIIVYENGEKRFRITQRGLYILDTYAKMDKLLIRKAMYKMKNTPEYTAPFL